MKLPNRKKNGWKLDLMLRLTAITALMLCVSACATQTPKTKLFTPPLPDHKVLAELDAHGLTPESAPHTWEFLGRVFIYYDVTTAMNSIGN